MTAKNIAKKYQIAESALRKLIIEYARQKCKKQRQMCAEEHLPKKYWDELNGSREGIEESSILNASEPEFK